MSKNISALAMCLLLLISCVKAQNFFRIDQKEYPFQLSIGGGVGILKAGSAYSFSPLFKNNIGMQMHITPHVYLSERLSVGIKLGGVFRPKFTDEESNSLVQPKFTPYGLLTSDLYLGQGLRKVRAYIGLSAGMSFIGELEGRTLDTDKAILFRRREKDWFLTVAPKAGIAFGTARIEFEYVVTTPFNPDYLGISLIGALPVSRQRFY